MRRISQERPGHLGGRILCCSMWDRVDYHYSVGADQTLLVVCFTSGGNREFQKMELEFKKYNWEGKIGKIKWLRRNY